MEQRALKTMLLGKRVVSAELMSQAARLACLEKEIEAAHRSVRTRLAERLRSQRRRSVQKLRLEKLLTAGYVFARDRAAWQRWHDTLRDALENTVTEVGLALPKSPLLERQVQKAIALAAKTTAPLTLHVNRHTCPLLQRLLTNLQCTDEAMGYSVVITDYLQDDTCIIETPSGLFEANAALEVDAFCEGVRSYFSSPAPAYPASGEAG